MKNVQKDKNKLLKFLKKENLGKSISFLGEGWSSFAYKTDDFIIRFSKTSLKEYEYEKKVCDYLKDYLNINLPSIKIFKNRKYSYACHREVKGNHFDFEKKHFEPKLANQCAQFLYDLHSCDKKDISKKIPHTVKHLYLSKPDLNEVYGNYFSNEEIDDFYTRYEKIKKIKSLKQVFLHRDFSPWNFLVDEQNNLTGVIDFVNSGIDELELEFVRFYRKDRDAFLNLLIENYEKISGIKIDKNRIKDLAFADLLTSGVLLNEPKLQSFKEEKFDWIINELKKFEK